MYDFLLLLIYRFNELVITKLQPHAFFSLETKFFCLFFKCRGGEAFLFFFLKRQEEKNLI